MIQPIVAGVYRVPGVVANCYVLTGTDGVDVIDAGLPYSHRQILAFLRRLGREPGAVRQILITHADRDHVGGAAALRAATGARVVAGPLEGAAMSEARETRRIGLPGPMRGAFEAASTLLFARVTPVAPDTAVNDGDELIGVARLRVLHTPGHTPGHMSYFAPDLGVLFAGDSLRSFGGRLRASFGANTDNEVQAQESAWRQLTLNPEVILAGHGTPVWTK
ncbi:MAG: MBL fold metallo-hydrolase [Anaerolineales bacterium]|nr:MBL fold metallo-hydrolase [Anaerolineales bacterium]